jgi:predicted nucleic acid-binding protein
VRSILIDTGPLVALFGRKDRHHDEYRARMLAADAEGLRFITTWPCIVEAAYLLEPPERYDLIEFVTLGGVQLYPFDTAHLEDMLGWMRTYTEPGKREMDLADASLYWLAVDTGINCIMTLDRRDFERYRLPDGRSFEIV